MIHVVAIVVTKPGQREAVLAEFRTLIPTVQAEEGCLEYGPAVDVAGAADAFGPDVFVVIEKWSGTAALRAHSKAPHMAAYAAKVKELLISTKVHVLDPC